MAAMPLPKNPDMRSLLVRALALAACAAVIPRYVAGHPAGGHFHNDLQSQDALAREVAATVGSDTLARAFRTGSARFDGEWAFGTFTMAAIGLGNVILAHPERRADYIPVMEQCADELVSKGTNAFGTEAWGDFGLDGLPGGRGHGYLGYSNLALSMIRLIHPETHHSKLHDELTEALAKRLEASPRGLFETYPGEAYPADMAMVAGSIALHDCATGAPPRPFWPAWRAAYSEWIDPNSGLLRQFGAVQPGGPEGPARSSGTALAAFALSFVDRDLSKRLFEGLRRSRANVLGFGAILEYPPGEWGMGDIDSGPVVLGAGVSATGFTISSAKLHGDQALFTELYRTADLFGVPVHRPSGMRFMSGGPLGNSILLAMTTATWEWKNRCRTPKKEGL